MRKRCPICNDLRELPSHLFELAHFCSKVGKTQHQEGCAEECVCPSTDGIARWLKRAYQIKSVHLDLIENEDDPTLAYCKVSEFENAEVLGKYYVELLRFFQVYNALEEANRFARQLSLNNGIPVGSKTSLREISRHVCEENIPAYFKHFVEAFGKLAKLLVKNSILPDEVVKHSKEVRKDYGKMGQPLLVIKGLRNMVVHGYKVALGTVSEDYDHFSEDPTLHYLQLFLSTASRIGAMYIQVNMVRYMGNKQIAPLSSDFQSEAEIEYFSTIANVDYLKKLHLSNGKSFKELISLLYMEDMEEEE